MISRFTTWPLSLHRQFWLSIFFGVVCFGLGPILWHESYCPLPDRPSQNSQYNPETESTNANKAQARVTLPALPGADKPRASENQTDASPKTDERPWLCSASLTDIAISLFTYCLVIVGYFQILRGEQNARDLERAIMFCGPGFVSAPPTDPGMQQLPGIGGYTVIGNETTFHILAANNGKTPGVLKELYLQFSAIEPSGNEAIYSGGQSFKFDVGWPPGFTGVIRNDAFRSPYTAPHYCYGYIKYVDIFRRPHVNRFCNKIIPNSTSRELAGSDAYNDWD